MISLIPSFHIEEDETPDVVHSLYDELRTLHEHYYDKLYSAGIQLHSTKPFQEANSTFLLEATDYMSLLGKRNVFISQQLKSIHRFISPSYVGKTYDYEHRTYHIVEDIKIRFPKLPRDLIEEFKDIYNMIESSLSNSNLYKKVCSKIFFIGRLPMWLYKHSTEESMIKYFHKETAPYIYEGAYTVKDLVPIIAKYLEISKKRLTETQEEVKRTTRQFEMFVERADDKERALKKKYKDKIDKIDAVFHVFRDAMETIFLQISVYYKAALRCYSKSMVDIEKTVQTMFDDLNDEYVRHHTLSKKFDYTKGQVH